jgi:hypothetical protein
MTNGFISRGEKQSNLYDVYDLTFNTPRFNYRNRVFSYLDLLNVMKKDIIKYATPCEYLHLPLLCLRFF